MIRVQQTVPPGIAAQPSPALGSETSSAVGAASTAIADFSRHAASRGQTQGHVPAVLLRADAVASSRIEAIATTTEHLSVALAEDDPERIINDEAALVADHVGVAQALVADTGPVDIDWLHASQARLLRHDPALTSTYRGAWRDCPVWVGPTREFADFEAPDHTLVPDLIDDLVAFTNRRDLQPVVHAAIAHAQFETIHPYADGNGRVGRLLIHRLLDAGGTPLPVAHGLLADTGAYIRGLTAYRAGDLDDWVTAFANAVTDAAQIGITLLDRLAAVRRHLHATIRIRGNSATRQLLDDLVTQPAVTASDVVYRYDVTEARASQLLNRLHDAGVLRHSELATGRERVWVAPDVIAALDSINEHPRRDIPTGPDI